MFLLSLRSCVREYSDTKSSDNLGGFVSNGVVSPVASIRCIPKASDEDIQYYR
jgi:hypothetical protein